MDPRLANAVGYLTSGLLRSLEQGPVEERLAKIEATLAATASESDGTKGENYVGVEALQANESVSVCNSLVS